MQDLGS